MGGPYPLPNSWKLIDSGGGTAIAFSCVWKGESRSFQHRVQYLWPQIVLLKMNGLQNKTKWYEYGDLSGGRTAKVIEGDLREA